MLRSLYSGVSGLRTHQVKMDVIGNNIANVNTIAFKSQSINFNDLMYQTSKSASGANELTGTGGTNARQVGLGVKSAAISTSITNQGSAQNTSSPFDIMISGSSFFIVSDGSRSLFTRDGAFGVDAVGNLVMTSNGYNVMGWGVDETGLNVQQETVKAMKIMSAENLTYPPESTTLGYMAGLIDKNDTNVNSASGKNVSFQFYDKLGYSYTAKFNVKRTATDGEFAMTLSTLLDSKGKAVSTTGVAFGEANTATTERVGVIMQSNCSYNPANHTFTSSTGTVYDPKTQMDLIAEHIYGYPNASAGDFAALRIPAKNKIPAAGYTMQQVLTNDSVGDGTGTPIWDNISEEYMPNSNTMRGLVGVGNTTITGFVMKYNLDTGVSEGVRTGAAGNPINKSFTLGMTGAGGNFSNVLIDVSNTKMYDNNGSSTINATAGDINGQGVGRRLGNMTGATISDNGRIYATYDNGMLRLLGQIAVAEFANPMGLQKEVDNLYSSTLNSGEFNGVGVDVTMSGGKMQTGVVEMSNVDLSKEFTEMITTQRGFQANSRIITVSDTLLEELVNLKR